MNKYKYIILRTGKKAEAGGMPEIEAALAEGYHPFRETVIPGVSSDRVESIVPASVLCILIKRKSIGEKE